MLLHSGTMKEKEWRLINYRTVNNVLSVNFIHDLYDQYHYPLNIFRFKNVNLFYKNKELSSYTTQEDWDYVIGHIKQNFLMMNNDYLNHIDLFCARKKSCLIKFLQSLDSKNLSECTDIQLGALLHEWYYTTLNEIYLINVAPLENGIHAAIQELLINEDLNSDDIQILLSHNEHTYLVKLELEIMKAIPSPMLVEDKINQIHQQFKNISIGYGSDELSLEIVSKQYDFYAKMDEHELNNAIKQIESYVPHIKEKKISLVNKVKNNNLLSLCDYATKLGSLRDRNKALLGESVARRNYLIDEIKKRHISYCDDLDFYTLSEIEDLLLYQKHLPDDQIEKRKDGILLSSVTAINTSTAAHEFYHGVSDFFQENGVNLHETLGVCASPGIVDGIAHVVKSPDELIHEDEILIVNGTDFNFMNSILKAKAIITEEGGILSHAAVVCRELHKPCIIGFKHITKLLQTGDLINVDATKGQVQLKEKLEVQKTNISLPHVCNLSDTSMDNTAVGNKAYNLWRLAKQNYNVPESLFLENNFFYWIIEQNKMKERLVMTMTSNDWKDKINELIDCCYIDLEKLRGFFDFQNYSYAVRSSSLNEDGTQFSYAGQYATTLFCKSLRDITSNVKKVWKSYINTENIYECLDPNNHIFSMGGIIIQKMIIPVCSGIAFSHHPLYKNHNMMVIECCEGLCDKLANHEISPSRYVVDKYSNQEIIQSHGSYLLSHDNLMDLCKIAKDLESHYGYVDIEWAIRNDNIYILQMRPITS